MPALAVLPVAQTLNVTVSTLVTAAFNASGAGHEHHEEHHGGMSWHKKSMLTKVHGACFIFAWFLCVSVGVLSARYLRTVAPQFQPFGLRVWYHLHRSLNLLAAALMIVGLVTIFVAHEWRWLGPKPSNTSERNSSATSLHTMFGLMSVVVAWLQPFGSLLRCAPDDPKRPYFNWGHRVVGVLGWLMAAVAIGIACRKFGRHFTDSDAAVALFAAFMAFTGASVIVSEVVRLRLSAHFANPEKRSHRPHTYLLTVFTVVSAAVCISFTVIIAGST